MSTSTPRAGRRADATPRLRTPADLFELLGIRTEVRSLSSPRWDGRSLNLFGLDVRMRVHEAMHWLLATAYRRSLPNFGHGPDAHCSHVKGTLEYAKARHEENMVSLMSAACLVMLGIWTEDEAISRRCGSEDEFITALAELVKRGLLDEWHRPLLPGHAYEGPPPPRSAVKLETLWVSDCGRYLARRVPHETFPDVVEIATGKVWLAHRYKPTSSDDPMCGMPEFAHMPVVWSNRGRRTRGDIWIEAFELTFVDLDMTKVKRYATPSLARYEATFRRRVPESHGRRHAFADTAIRRALLAETEKKLSVPA